MQDDEPDRGFLAEATVVGLIVFAVAVTIGMELDAAPGTFPDWVMAITTLAALFAAAIAARSAAKTYNREAKRDEDRARTTRRSQASKVAAWGGDVSWEWVANPTGDGKVPFTVQTLDILMRNASDVPVTKVVARTFFVIPGVGDEKFVGVLIPLGETEVPLMPPDTKPQPIPASYEARHTLQESCRGYVLQSKQGKLPGWRIEVALEFTDSLGNRWCRHADGRLLPVADQ